MKRCRVSRSDGVDADDGVEIFLNVGVHGRPATRQIEGLWIKGVAVTTGHVET